jgi:HEAT repeat protein
MNFVMKINRANPVIASIALLITSSLCYGQASSVSDNLAKLKDEREAVRMAAVKALGRSGDELAIEPLIEVMKKDQDAFVRAEAALALGSFKNLRAINALIAALSRADGNVTEAANQALKSLGPAAIPPMVEALSSDDSRLTANLIDAFELIGPAAIDPLIAGLKSNSLNRQRNASFALGRLKSPRAIPFLLPLLNSPYEIVRGPAAVALGEIGDPSAIDSVLPLLKDSDSIVRLSAAGALANMKATGTVEQIALLLKDPDKDVKQEVGAALSKMNSPEAIQHLMAAAKSKDLAVVAGGYKTFLRRLTPALTEVLLDALYEAGNEEMAQDFINSGNRKLASEARAWAKENGYEIFSIPTYGTGRRKSRG